VRQDFTGTQWFVRGTLTVFCALATLVLIVPMVAYKVCEGVLLAARVTRDSIRQVWQTPK
jgi:hypothetical protein